MSINNFSQSPDYGLKVFKKANCSSCHQWHGDGGGSYGGAAASIRETGLDKEYLQKIVECGRPGTNMPYFSKQAYKDDRCFGLTFSDFEGEENNRPLPARKMLNDRQIKALINFIVDDIKGKPITKDYCIRFFGKPSRICEEL
ncbi:MAG: cytochrome c [Rickettsiales bacterium TMED254]|nr:cytochrome C [Rickettsiales bacterium]RPF77601.1 MAG: cytochrome c [Rickettsiales bacterium TMED254]